MSKYLKYTEIVFTSADLLVAALADIGYTNVERGSDIPLDGWGRQRQKADVVVRKRVIGATYGDVGFQRAEKGLIPVIDDIDVRSIHGGKFLPALRTAYGERAAKTLATRVHGAVTRRVEGTKVKITIRR